MSLTRTFAAGFVLALILCAPAQAGRFGDPGPHDPPPPSGSHTVSTNLTGQGTVSPGWQYVENGQQSAPFTISPAPQWVVTSVSSSSSCAVTQLPQSTDYTVGPVNADCTLSVHFSPDQVQAEICYVRASATGSNLGTSWADAYTDLQSALGRPNCAEIRVAAGVYKPAADASDRNASFVINRALVLFGGYPASGGATRDPAANITVLSGDLDNDDTNTDGNNISETADQTLNNNSYHVVVIAVAGDAVTLDGFVVTAGRASVAGESAGNGAGLLLVAGNTSLQQMRFSGNRAYWGGGMLINYASPSLDAVVFSGNYAASGGGGLYCEGSGAGNACSPTLTHVSFTDNTTNTDGNGGAMFNDASNGGSSSPTLTNVTFSANSAISGGGAMMNYGTGAGTSSPILTNVTFTANNAQRGGAMRNTANGAGSTSSPILTNVTFSANSALWGGAMLNRVQDAGTSGPMLTNVTFIANSAHFGGAIYNEETAGVVTPTLTNVILWANSASTAGAEIYNVSATPSIQHSIVQGSGGSSAWDASLGTDGGGNLDADPLLGSLQDNGGFTLTMLPGVGSAAIDSGTCTGAAAADQRGMTRPQGPACDIGAVEAVAWPAHAGGVCHVRATASGANDGTSWTDAYSNLQDALADPGCTEIRVADGVYKPSVDSSDRSASFVINRTLKLLGGYAGVGANPDQRDLMLYATVLSGDLLGNDGPNFANNGDNSYHVLFVDGGAVPITTTTMLDGLIIRGGHANGAGNDVNGGGLYCRGSDAGHQCSPTLSNVTFTSNQAQSRAGAMYNNGENGGDSSPTLGNVTFNANSANYGGAMLNSGANGGNSSPTLRNVTFSGNNAGASGGAIFNLADGGSSAPTLSNVILWGNSSANGAEIYNSSATPTLDYSIVQGGCPAGSTCTHPIAGDPQLGAMQGNAQILLPAADSAAIDSGTCTGAPTSDQRGIARPQGAQCDIGAVEVRQFRLTTNVGERGSVVAATDPSLIGSGIGTCSNATCSARYDIEGGIPSIQLTAAPDIGGFFMGWSGDCSGIGASTEVAMDADRTCNAQFGISTYNVNTQGIPAAGGSVACTPNPVAHGQDSVCSVSVNASYVFREWSGDCSGSAATCTLANVTSVKSVTANFDIETHSIGGTVSGLSGQGLVLQLNGGNDLPIAANGSYVFGAGLEAGASYTVSVHTQPQGGNCSITNPSGTVGASAVTHVDVSCMSTMAILHLSVTDDSDYARYGQVRDYVITLGNSGNATASNVSVGSTMSPALDDTASGTQWICSSGTTGTTCTANGTGLFADTATVPAGGSVSWIVSTTVKPDSDEATAFFQAVAPGASFATDTDVLVIFRDGFDIVDADGTQVIEASPAIAASVLLGDVDDVVVLPPLGTQRIQALRLWRNGGFSLQVQRMGIEKRNFVRLLTRGDDGRESATPWTHASANARLVVGSVAGPGEQRLILLEGAARPLQISIDADDKQTAPSNRHGR